MSSDNSNHIETITPRNFLPPETLWLPERGNEVRELISHLDLDSDSGEQLIAEATSIISKCIPPNAPADSTTGLVLGYVQSGKTMSFTTVAALARDNGYPLVIVITGISNPLLDQSTSRLEADLRLHNNRKWRLFRNPKPEDRQSIADTLADWRDKKLPDHRRKTVLITVLKNTTNLRNLNQVLQQLNLTDIPALVIDDEADQAGLNTRVGQGMQSTTYQRLVRLRQNLPHHSYLQYTATPQAPLLINIIDVLSPRFVELLTPGPAYVGGETFFEQNHNLIRIIPASEIPSRTNPLHDVPPTLIAALRLFYLGVAAGFVLGDDQQSGHKPKNRSMLVHPSRETTGHGQYCHWITQIKRQWMSIFSLGEYDPERTSFIDSFKSAYDDLKATTVDLPDFVKLVSELDYSIRQTMVLEVNARPKTPQPTWKDTYSWILVGGQAMDRGFTVEGLTVTYMPRDMGVGNADTIEQRARFFGYKQKYLGFCRVFLEVSVRGAFQFYVEHERDIRKRLQKHLDLGRPLREWRRAFFLDSSLRPTRQQVLDLDYRHDTISNDWFWPKVPHGTDELLDANRKTVGDFIQQHNWIDSPGDRRRTPEQIHSITLDVSLRKTYEEFLIRLRLTQENDSLIFTGMLLQIAAYLEDHPDAICTVYHMTKGKTRLRSVNDDLEIPTLFQGANYADTAHKDMVYPGDEKERAAQGITIQIHTLQIRQKDRGLLIADNVPVVAVWMPQSMAQDWLVQKQIGGN